ncbi:N-6 DNA methylase [Pseudomonas cichorii]|nr:N-6 DNA methylase [Pseudomonas cichorii]
MQQKELLIRNFVEWCGKHIKGDEKGEAQIFLDQLFRAFGHEGFKEAGATCEMRVKNEKKGTSFADLVWKPVVLVEMKKRGEDLSKHYSQAFTYWTRLVPNRPTYVVLCNFDEFWIYDFNSQMDSPVDKVSLLELPERFAPLAFLFKKTESPLFGNHQETVTREAADKLVQLFRSLIDNKVPRPLAQRFTLQVLMALFAEDIGLLEKYFFARLLDDCTTPENSYDLIGQLFTQMNTPGVTAAGRYKGVPYFNGGLFAEPAEIELTEDQVTLLREAAKFNWSQVRPEIFGAIFEHSMDAEERRAFGAHYTSPVDIMKVVGPTIVDPWRARIDSAKTLKELEILLRDIESFKVLDPACGSGNFLYTAYREIKRLEARIYERMGEYKSIDASQRTLGFVTSKNFFGLDINPFAVELAKVTMMLAHKLAIDELHVHEQALPLDNLDSNFLAVDALMTDSGERTVWPEVDVIIGNPPFLGAKLLKPKQGSAYVKKLRKAYPEIPGMADFCVYWFNRSAEHLATCQQKNWYTGRAGLVGTQNIRSNASRVGGLDVICTTGTIVEAVDNQPWSGEANVNVSIANWVKSHDGSLIPTKKRLWQKIKTSTPKVRKPRGTGQASKEFELDTRLVDHINASLSDKIDLGGTFKLKCNDDVVVCQGITPGHDGFLIKAAQKSTVPAEEQRLLHPYVIGADLLSGRSVYRYIIDFEESDITEAAKAKSLFKHLEVNVLPDMLNKDEDSERSTSVDYWWRHWRARKELISSIATIPRYLACSRVTKRPLFFFVESQLRPGDALQVFALADDYSFGILQSSAHAEWFVAKCSNLTERLRYTAESVFETFPWPQTPSNKDVEAVAAAGRALREVQFKAVSGVTGGLRKLYKTLDLPGKNPLKATQDLLDAAVLKAYGFNKSDNILSKIYDLNLSVANSIGLNKKVTGPGIPESYPNPKSLLSIDAYGLTGLKGFE